jgi:predicted nucleic-acid-binding Zn-ribbon protein
MTSDAWTSVEPPGARRDRRNNELNTCSKCRHTKFHAGEVRGTGGLASSLFNVQSEKFSYVACAACGYTELYKKPLSDLQKVFDFLAG